MIDEGTEVRVTKGDSKGRRGIVKGHMPMSQVQRVTNGQELSMRGAIIVNLVEFDNGQQDFFEDAALETL